MEYLKIKKIDDLNKIKIKKSQPVYFLAGTTDFYPAYKENMVEDNSVCIDISSITKMQQIKNNKTNISIGACAVFSDIKNNAYIKKHFPLLVESASEIGAVQIQNRATIGGNIANASPAADSAPVLLVYDIIIKTNKRQIPITKIFTGPKQNVLKNGELITSVIFKKQNNNFQQFCKLGPRSAMAISKLSIAVCGYKTKTKFSNIRIAAGAVAPVPKRLNNVEKYILKNKIEEINLDTLKSELKKDINPIDDIRSTGEYRFDITAKLILDLITK